MILRASYLDVYPLPAVLALHRLLDHGVVAEPLVQAGDEEQADDDDEKVDDLVNKGPRSR
jgi:hypothetical protein